MTAQPSRRAVFLDRDGVINVDTAYCSRREDFQWIPGVLKAAARYAEAGYQLVIVTNQSGIGRGYYTEGDFQTLMDYVKAEFKKAGAPLAAVYFCPHHPEAKLETYRCVCDCRKPAPGMILKACEALDIDPAKSLMFGDKRGDMKAALSAGIGTRVLLGTDAAVVPEMVPEATHVSQSLATAAEEGIGLTFEKF